MFDFIFNGGHFLLFLMAASVLAVMPGPAVFYVTARTLAGGRRAGLASSLGLGVGELVHVGGGALGVSALVMASAEAFSVLKFLGALYLVYLGVKTWREAGTAKELIGIPSVGFAQAFREGVVVEALNPKTAAFFLAFLPQFVDISAGHVALQFLVLGTASLILNIGVDVVLVYAASAVRDRLVARPTIMQRMRQASGAILCALGVSLAFARRPA